MSGEFYNWANGYIFPLPVLGKKLTVLKQDRTNPAMYCNARFYQDLDLDLPVDLGLNDNDATMVING